MINEVKELQQQEKVSKPVEYHYILDDLKIAYEEEEFYLKIGEQPLKNGWLMFLSANVQHIGDMVRDVCPVLNRAGVAFRVVKDQSLAQNMNDFWYGANEVGKVITVFTSDEKMTSIMLQQLSCITNNYRGPEVANAIRAGEVIYISYVNFEEETAPDGTVNTKITISAPARKNIPFKIEKKYQYWKRKRFLKRRFIPLLIINQSPKGDLLKSIDIKGFRFDWCFIKEGKCNVFNDSYGRNIKDRLKWQMKVLKTLQGHVPVPEFIDFFEQGEECYLVMEYLEGINLNKKIYDIHMDKKWTEMTEDDRQMLIRYYHHILGILEKMHAMGFVHRDATANNFMILESGDIYTIDLELTYDLNNLEPDPPFSLGSFGYVSPEQIMVSPPTIMEDIYTAGALLLHIVAGKHPRYFIDMENQINTQELEQYIPPGPLLEIILKCLRINPEERPGLSEIKLETEKVLL